MWDARRTLDDWRKATVVCDQGVVGSDVAVVVVGRGDGGLVSGQKNDEQSYDVDIVDFGVAVAARDDGAEKRVVGTTGDDAWEDGVGDSGHVAATNEKDERPCPSASAKSRETLA